MQLFERDAVLLPGPLGLKYTDCLPDEENLVGQGLTDVAVGKHGDPERVRDVPLIFNVLNLIIQLLALSLNFGIRLLSTFIDYFHIAILQFIFVCEYVRVEKPKFFF